MVRQDTSRGSGTTVSGGQAPLNWHTIQAALSGRMIGRRVIYHARTGSTNDDVRALASKGEPEGTVVLADEQTAGRGRAGKSRWVTPANTSIAASVLLRPSLAPDRLGALAMIAGLASVEGVGRGAAVEAALKWPNDVLVGERKLGGILVESALTVAGVAFAVVGIGLNGNLHRSDLGPFPGAALEATTLLEASGQEVPREAIAIALLHSLEEHYARLRAGRLSEIVRAYRAALSTLGREVCLSGAGWRLEGIAEDVTETGALVVRLADGTRRDLDYGDVTVRPRRPHEERAEFYERR